MTEIQRKAELFARELHEGHLRKGEAKEPYAVHLEEVAELVKNMGPMKQKSVPPDYMTLLRIVHRRASRTLNSSSDPRSTTERSSAWVCLALLRHTRRSGPVITPGGQVHDPAPQCVVVRGYP